MQGHPKHIVGVFTAFLFRSSHYVCVSLPVAADAYFLRTVLPFGNC